MTQDFWTSTQGSNFWYCLKECLHSPPLEYLLRQISQEEMERIDPFQILRLIQFSEALQDPSLVLMPPSLVQRRIQSQLHTQTMLLQPLHLK